MPTSADWEAIKLVLVVVALFVIWFVPSDFMRELWRTWKGKRD